DGEDPHEKEQRWHARNFVWQVLRKPGQENMWTMPLSAGRPPTLPTNLPILMPFLCGDNPLTNTVPSKFLRLTDTQLFILKQWAEGRFINEIDEGWLQSPPYTPYLPYSTKRPKTGRALDAGVMSNVLGGAFC